MELKNQLNTLLKRRGKSYLQNDPLQMPHRYPTEKDREIVALLSALFAYGKVNIILRNLDDLLHRLGPTPYTTIVSLDETAAQKLCQGFVHRLHDATCTARLLIVLGHALRQYGSLKKIFIAGYRNDDEDISPALNHFSTVMKRIDSEIRTERESSTKNIEQGGKRGFDPFAHFFPQPSGGSACKRLCLFLRWVCRPEDGFDLGLWPEVSTAKLILPLDTHTGRIGQLLGLTSRRTPDWKMACEITDALKTFDPNDPVKYDFALAHIGISDGCTGSLSKKCEECMVQGLCTEGKKVQGVRSDEE